jgi:VIT1/CCC1 family predicted Fe2+/Mn2+ transporter
MAGLVAGAMSMAAGEYVSVSSQADTEAAELARERRELRDNPEDELAELVQIYEKRGLDPALALQVATQLTRFDALDAHRREELGISDITAARPVQAASTSAVAFAAGAALPLLMAWAAPRAAVIPAVAAATIVSLAALGALGASAGGASIVTGALRVTAWGALAMVLTAAVGVLFGAAV